MQPKLYEFLSQYRQKFSFKDKLIALLGKAKNVKPKFVRSDNGALTMNPHLNSVSGDFVGTLDELGSDNILACRIHDCKCPAKPGVSGAKVHRFHFCFEPLFLPILLQIVEH